MILEHIQDQSPFNFIISGTSSRSFTLHGVRSRNAKINRHNSFKIIPSGFCKWKQIEISEKNKKLLKRAKFSLCSSLTKLNLLPPTSQRSFTRKGKKVASEHLPISARWKLEVFLGLFNILLEPSQNFVGFQKVFLVSEAHWPLHWNIS